MAAAIDGSLPVCRQSAALIDGVHTDFLASWYSDRILVLVTQFQKFGTLVSVTRDQPVARPDQAQGGTDSHTFTTKVLMGDDLPIWHVYGQQIFKAINGEDGCKPVLVAIALQNHSPEILKCILGQLESIRQVQTP
ncbi:predicted protein [Nematostella vectensis]|uniref:Proteasome assembly chaperone 3 n=2 Tax=Nematostella vectensis TaxID=45351 RepID=PSMG3_NEMVE|nr:RecName: Full=Proteasome assembly chaperone 3 [Nematostella vectensis]EDO34478.1 predicted protein [Nematostella vectensis]|eukprot:XP_001626578.1 predicted protein [Nematostella vectensis]